SPRRSHPTRQSGMERLRLRARPLRSQAPGFQVGACSDPPRCGPRPSESRRGTRVRDPSSSGAEMWRRTISRAILTLAVSRSWDASTYDRLADPQAGWGKVVVERAPVRGDERVLDAGCGTGRVTAMLLERLPRGRVVALDGSPAMIEGARRRLGDDPRV